MTYRKNDETPVVAATGESLVCFYHINSIITLMP